MDIETFKSHIEELARVLPAVSVIEGLDRTALRCECNPHVHSGWELKELESGELQLVPPGTAHETTGICPWSLEAVADSFTLRFSGRFHCLNRRTGGGKNLLPELFALYLRTVAPRLRRQLLHTVFEALLLLAETPVDRPEEEDRYFRALDYMKRNYYKRELGVEDLALFAGVTPQYLNRLFRRHGDAGVRRSLIVTRLEKARELLESGRYLVSDVARLTGWSCPFYFCNSFKRHYGIPPIELLNSKEG